jgi:hypothetical protein
LINNKSAFPSLSGENINGSTEMPALIISEAEYCELTRPGVPNAGEAAELQLLAVEGRAKFYSFQGNTSIR